MRTLALGGVAGPAVFSLVALACAALRPGYSHLAHVISELGASGTPNASLMNYGGFVPGGLMLAAFAVALRRVLPPRPLATAAAALVGLFALGLVASGVSSCDPGSRSSVPWTPGPCPASGSA
jgi:hypothetical membrane protein